MCNEKTSNVWISSIIKAKNTKVIILNVQFSRKNGENQHQPDREYAKQGIKKFSSNLASYILEIQVDETKTS